MDDRLALAEKYYQSNLDEQARALVEEVLAEPNPPRVAVSFAATLAFEARDLEAAVGYCDRLLEDEPDDAHTLLIKGRALFDLGRREHALTAMEAAVAADPELAAAHYNLGLLLQSSGQPGDAAKAYKRAIALQSPYPVAWNNLGLVLEQTGDIGAAVTAFRTAIDQFPQFSMAHNNLGAVLAASGRYSESAEAYGQALEHDPANADARTNLAVALLEQGELDAAIAEFDRVLAEDPTHPAAADNRRYAELYRCDDAQVIRALHAQEFPSVAPSIQFGLNSGSPLRVGFISPDFRRHSVSFFALPLIETLDRNAVAPVLFNAGTRQDSITARYQAAAAEWFDVAAMTDPDLITLMRDARLDAVVDLAGRTTGNRLSVLAARVAPVQIMALGYAGPTGVAAVDYWLCDAITNPPESVAAGVERDRPLRLAHMHVFAPPDLAPDVSPLPMQNTGSVTFGSFNKRAKISEACVALWAEVLGKVAGSRLLLKAKALGDGAVSSRLISQFAGHGIDAARIECRGWTEADTDHLGLYAHIDIALDTFPYNGTTTTCEALWMGVPVMTLRGESHAARVGASLLTSAGMTDWIAPDAEGYVAKIQRWAQSPEELGALRAGLREQLRRSVLTDAKSAAADFTSVLQGLMPR